MPTTLRERRCLSDTIGLQSQSELEQSGHTWSDGYWYPKDHLSWMGVDECSHTDVGEMEMDTKPSERLAFKAGDMKLTLPPIPSYITWVDHSVGQCAPDRVEREPLGDWRSFEFWNAPLFTESHCSSSLFAPVHRYPRLPSLEPSTATSESFPAIPEEVQQLSRLPKFLVHSPVPSIISSDNVEAAPKPKAKRGRSRLIRDCSGPPTLARRVPHNQVEQKYRNGLNAELERLRHTVSTQMQHNIAGTAKLSKAMVLSGAIDCIKIMEAARDVLETENKGLKRSNKRLRRGKAMTANE